MYQPWKSISQKIEPKHLLICAVSLTALLLVVYSGDSCEIDRIGIISQIDSYQKSLDPESCDGIMMQIDSFNDICDSQIEILDCG